MALSTAPGWELLYGRHWAVPEKGRMPIQGDQWIQTLLLAVASAEDLGV